MRSIFPSVSTRVLGLLSAAFVGLVASPSHAQIQSEISVQRFDPAAGQRNFITTRGVRTDGEMTWTAALMANYGYRPFTVIRCENSPCNPVGSPGTTVIPVVENIVTGDLYGSLTIIPRLQVALRVPVTWAKGQGITAQGDPQPDGLSAVGLGDVQLEGKVRFYGDVDSPFAAGAFLYGTVPFGNLTAAGTYIGSATGSLGGALVGDLRFGELTIGVNAGFLGRGDAQIGPGTRVGSEVRWSAAAGYQVGPLLRLIVDSFGAAGVVDPSSLGANSIEVDGAVQIVPLGSPLTITAGGGAGALRGVGTPEARVFLGVMYGGAEVRDRDRDNILDNDDGCPDDAEDLDGYEDSDGCPEADNDQDGLPDTADKCSKEAEDVDQFEDKDGCPEPDNDRDGVADLQDTCPIQPETVNGVDDLDGCPDAKDSDKDGVADDTDKCPNEREDTDNFEDTDGCPDPDNDKDGVPDDKDECIDQPEDKKGKGREKEDGCPVDA